MAGGEVLAQDAILIFAMNVERWHKIKKTFNEAAEMSVANRHQFLNKVCLNDAAMRGEIEKMLRFADDENDTFESNAFELLGDNYPGKIPERIGKYKILREIGRGGMGAVYEAIYETENFSQRVALKVIKRGMDTDQILSRFRHEQRILASLVHPNIAQFLDGGMTADNLPFYAMEFVEGKTLDDFCAEENLNVEDRLKLFRQICSAVQYAHQNLIIHRDLKPKNILVTKDGTPKLLDFGIGKILTPQAETAEAGTATQLGLMTPAYASPEQIQGKRIGTASDVYSLGVILYELLTGKKPYKFSAHSQLEIERAVCESEPIRPSSVVRRPLQTEHGKSTLEEKQRTTGNGRRTKSLKGDLDNIILKALRKEPAARYASVQEFSEDLRRYLEGLPVMARPHTLGYRAAKFIKRNQVGVTAAALIFLSLCVGITVAIWQARRAEQQRVLAEKRFADVRELANNVVFKYHDAIADLPGSTAAREMLVGDALRYLDRLAGETAEDTDLQKELALAYLKMGDVQGKMYTANVGDTEGALASYQKAIALFEKIVESKPEDYESKDNLIQAYDNLAFLMLRSGGGEEKILVEKALHLYEQIPATEAGNRARTLKLIDLYIRYGDTKSAKRTEALAERQKALPLVEKLQTIDAQDYEIIKASARIHQRIGTDYYWLGREAEQRGEIEKAKKQFAQSLDFQEKSHAAAEKMYALAPDKPESLRYLAAAYGNSAESLSVNNRIDEALQMADKLLAIVEKTLQTDPNNQETRLNLSNAYEIYANIYLRRGDDAQVINYTQKALTIDEAIYQADRKNREVFSRIKDRHNLLAKIYAKRGDAEKAEFHRRKIEEIIS
jgi:eukaryotic-like serine/threonine-protein kinase